MATSSEPNQALRGAIAAAHAVAPQPLALSISAEAGALYHHLTGELLGYPADGETMADIERYRLAALAGAIGARLLEHCADDTDPENLADPEELADTAADALLSYPRLTDEGRAILEAIAPVFGEQFVNVIGPILDQALPHLFAEGAPDAG